jgi:hypothetical protein
MAMRIPGPFFGPELFFRLWGIPFVFVGLYFVFGRFFADALARSRTYYGVTNERALIVTTWFGRRVRSIGLRTLGDVSTSERSDQSGTITFGAGQPTAQPFGRSSRYSPPAFDMIDNVKNVYQLIISTQKQLLSA